MEIIHDFQHLESWLPLGPPSAHNGQIAQTPTYLAVHDDFGVSTRSSSAPPRPSAEASTTVWTEPQAAAAHRRSHQPKSKMVSKLQAKGTKPKTTIIFIPPNPSSPPPLYHPSPLRPAPAMERPQYMDWVSTHPGVTSMANTRVPICTRKTTVKTNTITISSKPLPPPPQPTPPAIGHESSVEVAVGELYKVAEQKRVRSATQGEWTVGGDHSRRSFSETRYMRLPSIDLGPGLDLSDSFGGVGVKDQNSVSPDPARGRVKTRPRLRVQLPPPSIGSSKGTPPRENRNLEFVIHAGDVIPSEAPPRTHEHSKRWDSECHTKSVDPVSSTEKGKESGSTPRVTLTVADEIEWPDYLLDPSLRLQTNDSQNPGKILSKPSLLESPLATPDFVQPASLQDLRVSPVEQNRHLPIKRKPAPPVRVYSLPITLNEPNDSNSYNTASMATQLQNLLSTEGPELRLPRTGPDPNWDFLDPYTNGGTMLPPRSHSSPPGSGNPHHTLNTILPTPTFSVEIPTGIDWRTLSSLDLTCYDELTIYLESLSVLTGAIKNPSNSSCRLSTCSSLYSNDLAAPAARISSFSTYSHHSNHPSPSEYMAYPSPQFKYTLVPRPQQGAAELPGIVPVELPSSEGILVSSNSPSHNKGSVVSVGQLRLPSFIQPSIKKLDIIFTAPSRYSLQDQDMPCRTTILKGSRRITFTQPGRSQGITDSADDVTNNASKSHNSSSRISINTALKIGSGKGLLNRENSRRIRERGESILRKRGKDVYLELVILGNLAGESCYEAFLNRLDGSVWFVLKSGTNATGSLAEGFFDQWLSTIIPRKQPARERVVAVRWADGLDCVNDMRGLGAGIGGKGTIITRQRAKGEMEVECPETAAELEGVEIYLGEAVDEEEDGWFVPEGW